MKKDEITQTYKGFDILAQREPEGYMVYLSTQNINGGPNPSFKIVQNAPSFVKALKKAKQFIDEIPWESVGAYTSMEIEITNEFLDWTYKIRNQGATIIQGGFEYRIDAIQCAFIRADEELQKLQKQ